MLTGKEKEFLDGKIRVIREIRFFFLNFYNVDFKMDKYVINPE